MQFSYKNFTKSNPKSLFLLSAKVTSLSKGYHRARSFAEQLMRMISTKVTPFKFPLYFSTRIGRCSAILSVSSYCE